MYVCVIWLSGEWGRRCVYLKKGGGVLLNEKPKKNVHERKIPGSAALDNQDDCIVL